MTPSLSDALSGALPSLDRESASDVVATTDDEESRDALTGSDEPAIGVGDVSVAYGDLDVLTGVSLAVAPGELVGLVGPNGAGKTTLIEAINGVREPDAGTVRVAGDDVHALSSRVASRRVATVPQDTTVAFEFSVEDVVEMGRTPYHGRLSRDPDADEAVERALERTETARFRERTVGSLSGGERQRVVLARALAQEAPALLLDEPTASLDVNHQVRTLELVRDLVDEDGTAALAAIHDLDLAARYCDRIAVLSDGDLLAVGDPRTVLTDDHLRTAFDAETAVLSNPVTGSPTVTPLDATADLHRSVHVAGSGEAAARALVTLAAAGASVTAGVLPDGDVAAVTARDLGVDVVTAPPFAPIDASTEATARDLLSAADVAVLAGTAPSSVRALVRDHDCVVRVDADSTADGDGSAGSRTDDRIDAVATTDLATLVETVDRVGERRVEADD